MKRTALLSLALVPILAMTACSGSDSDTTSTPKAGSDASSDAKPASATTSADPGIISPSLPAVPDFTVEPNGVISDIKVDSCDTKAGPVTAKGTATNSGKFERDIVVVVNWAVATTSDVLARGVTKIEDVPPGESRDWEVSADLAGDQQVTCVPTAYAGQLK